MMQQRHTGSYAVPPVKPVTEAPLVPAAQKTVAEKTGEQIEKACQAEGGHRD